MQMRIEGIILFGIVVVFLIFGHFHFAKKAEALLHEENRLTALLEHDHKDRQQIENEIKRVTYQAKVQKTDETIKLLALQGQLKDKKENSEKRQAQLERLQKQILSYRKNILLKGYFDVSTP
jgi:hypothetical protein